jgi:16S rRNA (cytidine1402-2'-O)-methyltransferase
VVSDPGGRLVRAVAAAGHGVVPIPGPSAPIAALSASGLPADRFLFLGFPPRGGAERRALLARVAACADTAVLFEAPGRLVALLEDLSGACGEDRPAAVARELTKIHEEVRRGTLAELAAYYRQEPPRGEIVVVVGGAAPTVEEDTLSDRVAVVLADALLDHGVKPSAAAREVARRTGLPRNRAYEVVHARARERPEEG